MSARSFFFVLLVVTAVASSLVLAVGVAPLTAYATFFTGTSGSGYAIGQVFFRLTPLVLCGLAVSVPLRAGLFNIGAESQVIVGAFACAVCGAQLPAATPAMIAIPICLVAAAAGGAAVGFALAFLRTRFGIHEVIGGLLGNLVIRAVMVGVGAHFYLRESVHTAPVIEAARLPRGVVVWQGFAGSAVNAALLLALLLLVLVPLWEHYSRRGFLLRALGENPDAVRAAGESVPRLEWLAMTAGGALGGLASVSFVLGYKYFYEEGFSGGVGFLGLAVAMIGRGKALGRSVGLYGAALLLALLQQGGFAMNAIVPKEISDVLSAVLLAGAALAIAASQKKSPRGPAW